MRLKELIKQLQVIQAHEEHDLQVVIGPNDADGDHKDHEIAEIARWMTKKGNPYLYLRQGVPVRRGHYD